jgi:GH25 family lysozyme M1 (1,4-beta-N-acetylmuramidase)
VLKHTPLAAGRRLVPLAGAAVLVLAAGFGGSAASAATTSHTAAANAVPVVSTKSSPHRSAYDPVTKKYVTVYKPTVTTPVHPEKLTHPQNDWMGGVTEGHGGGHGKNAQPAASAKAASTASAATAAPGAKAAATVSALPGIDVSSYQGDIDWASVAPDIDFVYAKATEGTYYTNPDFDNQYEGPYDEGLIRGAYHFGIPDNSTGQAQADYFADNGGGWSADGQTLPGALDIEYNPYGSECYGLTTSEMTTWIWDFVDEYAYDTGVYPVIYTTTDWWSTCTGDASGFQDYDPLWIACYCSDAGTLPAGYGVYTFWQYADSGSEPGDQDVFNGAYSRLQALALG